MTADTNLGNHFYRLRSCKLMLPRQHSAAAAYERHGLVIARVQLFARLLSVLTLAWLIVDLVTVPPALWGLLAPARLLVAIGLACLSRRRFLTRTAHDVYTAIGALYAISLCFFLFVNITFFTAGSNTVSAFAIDTYLYGPFLIGFGIALFPLTAIECAFLAFPVLGSMAMAALLSPELTSAHAVSATLWQLGLTLGIASIAAMSQLELLLELVEKSARDALTRALNRKTAERLIGIEFAIAARRNAPLSILFFDLDEFKQVNDRFGHSAGDTVLRQAADSIKSCLRTQDIMARWGGEEFVVVLPDTDSSGARNVVRRIAEAGVGSRPDGRPQTMSIGLAERAHDKAADLSALIEIADKRMYAAKQAGRNRCVGPEPGSLDAPCKIEERTEGESPAVPTPGVKAAA